VGLGTHLQRTQDVNLETPPTPTTIGIAGTNTLLTFTEFSGVRPIAGFDRMWLFGSEASSVYHALSAQLNKRLAQNFQLQAS